MSTRRQRQILRNKRIAFERKVEENLKKAKEPKEETVETKIVKKKKTTKKEDK